MSVDTRSETVLTAAHNLRNQVIPPEAHRTFAADLLRALLAERDEAIRQRGYAEQWAATAEARIEAAEARAATAEARVQALEGRCDEACQCAACRWFRFEDAR